MPAPRFDATVGNPPYQMELSKGNSFQIYPRFYKLSALVASVVCLVIPSGWQRSTGGSSAATLHGWMRKDRQLQEVHNYSEAAKSPTLLFPDAATSGVSIVLRGAKEIAKPLLFEEGLPKGPHDFSKPQLWSARTEELFVKLKDLPSMASVIWSTNHFNFNTNSATNEQSEQYPFLREAESEATYSVWARGADGKYRWFYIDKAYTKLRTMAIPRWKVIFPKSGPDRIHRAAKILKPGELTSATFIGASFDTREECEGFISYLKTDLYRALLTERATNHDTVRTFHEFVPDLTHVVHPETGVEGWANVWTDRALKLVLANVLTEDDWAYIHSLAARLSSAKGSQV